MSIYYVPQNRIIDEMKKQSTLTHSLTLVNHGLVCGLNFFSRIFTMISSALGSLHHHSPRRTLERTGQYMRWNALNVVRMCFASDSLLSDIIRKTIKFFLLPGVSDMVGIIFQQAHTKSKEAVIDKPKHRYSM